MQTPGLIPTINTIQKLIFLSFIPHSKPIPMRVAFCLLFKLFITHTAETFHYPRTWVMMWCTRSTLMPRCCKVITLHRLIHFGTCVWVHNMGWTTRAYQVLNASYTLFESLAPVKHCCMLQTVVLCTCFIREQKSAGLAPSAHRNWKMHCYVCQDESMNLLHWATRCCAEITQSSLLMKCAYCGW